jgi:mannose-6-phosphate isomerase-like protein (cupin superfamily)
MIRNFLKLEPELAVCHDGEGLVKIVSIYDKKDLDTPLQFIHYTTLPPRTSIGLHKHGDDEEVYVILKGTGIMEVDGQKTQVAQGDTILNKPFGSHALYNTSDNDELSILVFEVKS